MTKETDRKSVELIASGYEWCCPKCNSCQREIEISYTVKCRKCETRYDVADFNHAFG